MDAIGWARWLALVWTPASPLEKDGPSSLAQGLASGAAAQFGVARLRWAGCVKTTASGAGLAAGAGLASGVGRSAGAGVKAGR